MIKREDMSDDMVRILRQIGEAVLDGTLFEQFSISYIENPEEDDKLD